jgi:hypothetical protein
MKTPHGRLKRIAARGWRGCGFEAKTEAVEEDKNGGDSAAQCECVFDDYTLQNYIAVMLEMI